MSPEPGQAASQPRDLNQAESAGELEDPRSPSSSAPAGLGSEHRLSAGGFEQAGFLHPSSILFEVLSHIRRFIVPAILGVIGAAQGSYGWIGIAVVAFSIAFTQTLVRYFTLRYGIQEDDFVVTEGLLFRRVRSVPLRRIQNVDLVQNLLHRFFGVFEVNIETASGDKPEATLRVLTEEQVEQLRQAIFGRRQQLVRENPPRRGAGDQPWPTQEQVSGFTADTGEEYPAFQNVAGQTLVEIPVRDLTLAGLASNRGMILLGIAVGFFFQFDLEDRLDLDLVSDRLQNESDPWRIGLIALAGVLVLMLFLRILGIAWYIHRFYDYRLTRSGEDLRIACGLLTKVSATIPRKRIQFISVHRPWLMRLLGLASIRIETAGGAGSENESAAATVSRRWFLPVIRESQVTRILRELRPDLAWDAQSVHWHGVSPRTSQRLLRIALVTTVLISLIGTLLIWPWGWAAGPIAFPIMMLVIIKKSRSRKYARTEWGVAYQSGIFTRKLSFSFYDRIQGLEFSQSPFDRRWQMARLPIDSAAAGPAEHAISVAYLDQEFASRQFEQLQIAAARHRPSWA